MDMVGSTDGFCRIFIIKSDGNIIFPTQIIEKNEFRTQTIHENNNPIWNYDGVIEFSFLEREIDLWKLGTEVWDEDTASSDLIGKGEVNLKKLLNKPGKKIKFEIELSDNKQKKIENTSLNLEITFEIEKNK